MKLVQFKEPNHIFGSIQLSMKNQIELYHAYP